MDDTLSKSSRKDKKIMMQYINKTTNKKNYKNITEKLRKFVIFIVPIKNRYILIFLNTSV